VLPICRHSVWSLVGLNFQRSVVDVKFDLNVTVIFLRTSYNGTLNSVYNVKELITVSYLDSADRMWLRRLRSCILSSISIGRWKVTGSLGLLLFILFYFILFYFILFYFILSYFCDELLKCRFFLR
jgi:hypothetical protein